MVGVRKKGNAGIGIESSKILSEPKSNSNRANDVCKVLCENIKSNLKMKATKLSKPNQPAALSVNSFDKITTETSNMKRILRKRSDKLPEKENIDTKIAKLKKVSKNGSVKNMSYISKTNPTGKASSIPVWKKNQHEGAKTEKTTNVDVYDISLDEEMACEGIIKKKRLKPPKHKVVKNNARKRSKNLLTRNANLTNTRQIDANILPKMTDENILLPSSSSDDAPMPSSVPDASTVMQPSTDSGNPNVSSHFDNETFLLNLADEIEKSFVVPILTSTPAEIACKPKDTLPKFLDESYIPYKVHEHKKTAQSKVHKNKYCADKDITLFESPTKKKKTLKQAVIEFDSPQKPLQLNLFGENPFSTGSPKKLESSVLKPSKAYHTPDNFKTHLVRSKRPSKAERSCEEKKSKEQLLIEKMSQHFEEISGTELCIE